MEYSTDQNRFYQPGWTLLGHAYRDGKRPVALVVLDAFGKYTHFADANRLRSWIETGKAAPSLVLPKVIVSKKIHRAV